MFNNLRKQAYKKYAYNTTANIVIVENNDFHESSNNNLAKSIEE